MAHPCAIHRFIFENIYSWAETPRAGGFLSKGNTLFAHGIHIKSAANKLFDEPDSERKLKNLDKEKFIQRLAYCMGEVNALHPFCELALKAESERAGLEAALVARYRLTAVL